MRRRRTGDERQFRRRHRHGGAGGGKADDDEEEEEAEITESDDDTEASARPVGNLMARNIERVRQMEAARTAERQVRLGVVKPTSIPCVYVVYVMAHACKHGCRTLVTPAQGRGGCT